MNESVSQFEANNSTVTQEYADRLLTDVLSCLDCLFPPVVRDL